MGVLPLQFAEGCDVTSLGLTGHETFSISGLRGLAEVDLIGATVHVDGDGTTFDALARIDTPTEAAYFRHGGILRHVVRQVAATNPAEP
jgi:aconitate hydratase